MRDQFRNLGNKMFETGENLMLPAIDRTVDKLGEKFQEHAQQYPTYNKWVQIKRRYTPAIITALVIVFIAGVWIASSNGWQ